MDAIQSLTRLRFPNSAREALEQLEGCLINTSGNIPGIGTQSADLAEQIVEQFIFYSGRGKPGVVSIIQYHHSPILVLKVHCNRRHKAI